MTTSMHRVIAVMAGLVAFTVPATAAHSLWSTTTTSQLTVTTAASALPAPSQPTCSWTGSAVTLTWMSVPGAVSYLVNQVGVTGPASAPASTSVTLTSESMPQPQPSQQYDVTVKAFDGSSYSVASPVVQIRFNNRSCK